MVQTGNTVILLALLLVSTIAEEDPEPIFRALGGELDMGYCFGNDIAVYKLNADGRELLGQFSRPSVLPPDAFKGRISLSTEVVGLLGLKLTNLQFSDSGIYIKECWSDSTMENYRKHYLYVCDMEFDFKEISLTPGTGADLVCNMGSTKHAEIKWYRDVDNATLFMDTKISLEPLQAEFKNLIQVHDEGSFLHVSDEFIQDRPSFFCMIMEGEQCKSFQTLGLPEDPEMKTVYPSLGDTIVLKCSVHNLRQNHWETPFGQVNSSAPVGTTKNQMFVSTSNNSEDFSLVIRSLTSNHSGSYKCFSTFLIEDYVVNVCPLLKSTNISFFAENKKVVLPCNFRSSSELSDKLKYASVLWYRKNDGKDIQIMDSGDPSVAPPNDLQGRMHFSKEDSSLIITDPKKEDSGLYWCVVLLDNEETDEDDDEGDYDVDDGGKEDHMDSWIMEEEYMDVCHFRQVTNLKFQSKTERKWNNKIQPEPEPEHVPEHVPEHKPEPESEPEPETNLTMYALCAVIVCVSLLAVICILVFLKIRAKKRSATIPGGGFKPCEEEGIALNTTKT